MTHDDVRSRGVVLQLNVKLFNFGVFMAWHVRLGRLLRVLQQHPVPSSEGPMYVVSEPTLCLAPARPLWLSID